MATSFLVDFAILHRTIIKDRIIPFHFVTGSKREDKTCVLSKSIEYYSGIKPPVCFMYSGMGSQWCQMGVDLMNIPIFSAAIEKYAVPFFIKILLLTHFY